MKKNVLFASLLLNVILLVAFILSLRKSEQQPMQSTPLALTSHTSVTTLASSARSSVQAKFAWTELESTNYLEYVERLKGVQCPWPTICDLIIGEINRLYAPKLAALQRSMSPPYWKSRSFIDPRHDPEVQGRLRALKDDRRLLIKQILNIDIEDFEEKLSGEIPKDDDLSFLPEDKRALVYALRQSTYDRWNAITKTFRNGRFLPSQEAERNRVKEEFDTQLPAILNKEEYLEYQLRLSDRANNLRRNLEFFHANESEFRAVFQIDQEYQKMLASSVSQAEREAAVTYLKVKLESQLGPERYAEYRRANDPNYDVLAQVAAHYNLPEEKVVEAYNIREELISKYLKMSLEPGIGNDVREGYSRAMEQEARQKLLPILGEAAFKDYAPIENSIFKK